MFKWWSFLFKHQWFNGRIVACQTIYPCSSPGRCSAESYTRKAKLYTFVIFTVHCQKEEKYWNIQLNSKPQLEWNKVSMILFEVSMKRLDWRAKIYSNYQNRLHQASVDQSLNCRLQRDRPNFDSRTMQSRKAETFCRKSANLTFCKFFLFHCQKWGKLLK